jgi:hypothetical protein
MPTRRTPITRSPGPLVTPAAVEIYARAKRLIQRGEEQHADELNELSYQLALELNLKPWATCPLDTIGYNKPAAWEDGEDWWQAAALADELAAALKARRKAERAARKAAAMSTPEPPPPAPEQPPS